jgi:hypothetical protein
VGEQDTGIVLKDPVLVAQDGMNQAAHGLRRGMAGGSFASEEVDQSGFAEEVPGFVAGLRDAVGVEDQPIAWAG